MTEQESRERLRRILAITSGLERPPTTEQRARALYKALAVKALGFSTSLKLFLVFLVMFTLKCAKVFAASWWLVTAPLWAPVALVLIPGLLFIAAVVLGLVLYGLVKLVSWPFRAAARRIRRWRKK